MFKFSTLIIGILVLVGFSVGDVYGNPVLKKIQYPILDSDKAFSKGRLEFKGYIKDGNRRIPGLSAEDRKIVIREGFKVTILNEYKLYDKTAVEDEYVTLMMERYCSRYNNNMLSLAKESKKFKPIFQPDNKK